jgi:prepilin-type N-terminal cleavage/methylation domain-containing protein
MRARTGFTIVEVVVAMIVVSIGVLGMLGTAALVTRMLARGRWVAGASAIASSRLERLRPSACIASQRTNSADTTTIIGTAQVINSWSFTDAGNNSYRVRLITSYMTGPGRTRTDTLEATVVCIT